MNTGITVLRIGSSEAYGWMIAFYCSKCRKTTFIFSPFAAKPTDGDFYLLAGCPDVAIHNFDVESPLRVRQLEEA